MFRRQRHGQTFIEYTILIGVLVTVLIAMTPMMRRGIQGMVKIMADQVGNQEGAEQTGGRFGQLINSTSYSESRRTTQMGERLGESTKTDDDEVYSQTSTYSNQGFSETNL